MSISNDDSNSHSQSQSNVVNENSFPEIKEIVIKWLKLDDTIKNLLINIKDLKDEKKQYEEYILSYMTQVKGDIINTSKGNLRRYVSQTKTSIKQEHILSTIQEMTSDEEKARNLTDLILKKREVKERIYLKRNKLRSPKKNEI